VTTTVVDSQMYFTVSDSSYIPVWVVYTIDLSTTNTWEGV